MTQHHFIKTDSMTLAPADAEASEFLQRVKAGTVLRFEVKRARNYQFHKRFFALLHLAYDYWTPAGGAVTPAEKHYLKGFIHYLITIAGHGETLEEIERTYNERTAQSRIADRTITKSFDAFRKWATIEAGYFTEYIFPDNTSRREAVSVSFARMNEDEFRELYKAVFSVLWNTVLCGKFRSEEEAESAALNMLGMAA